MLLLVVLPVGLFARGAAPAGSWTATDPPIDLAHIDTGKINRHGEAVGYHHRPNGVDPPGARVLRIVQPPDANGVYRARVALRDPASGEWIDKRAASTFFPDAMSDDAVIAAVLAAFYDGRRRGDGRFVGDFGPRLRDRGLVSCRADCRRLPAARPLMRQRRIALNGKANAGLISARRHPAGHLEARATRGSGRRGAVLAGFLQSDVQGDLAAARAMLAEIGAAERGEAPQPPALGNAYAVSISPDRVTIANAVIEDSRPEHYDFAEIRLALGTWIAAIERARRNPA